MAPLLPEPEAVPVLHREGVREERAEELRAPELEPEWEALPDRDWPGEELPEPELQALPEPDSVSRGD